MSMYTRFLESLTDTKLAQSKVRPRDGILHTSSKEVSPSIPPPIPTCPTPPLLRKGVLFQASQARTQRSRWWLWGRDRLVRRGRYRVVSGVVRLVRCWCSWDGEPGGNESRMLSGGRDGGVDHRSRWCHQPLLQISLEEEIQVRSIRCRAFSEVLSFSMTAKRSSQAGQATIEIIALRLRLPLMAVEIPGRTREHELSGPIDCCSRFL